VKSIDAYARGNVNLMRSGLYRSSRRSAFWVGETIQRFAIGGIICSSSRIGGPNECGEGGEEISEGNNGSGDNSAFSKYSANMA
jgi:hypothetical protein